jgi:6-pyruvoyltetrahydropterin/6-carboxytetrahydropterin synthase
MPFVITTTLQFPASHQLRLYDGSMETLHEHLWGVKVTVGREALDSIGVVMDFHELERLLGEILGPWRGRSLNTVAEFADLNPSAEVVAQQIARRLALPAEVKLVSVEIWETLENSAVFAV